MLEYVLYFINYKTTRFGRQWPSSVFINSKRYKMVQYNLCNGVLIKIYRHQYPVFFIFGYCYDIGSVGNSFG
jgi:hypothetical protein